MADHSSFYSGTLGVVNDEFSEQPGTRLTFVHAKLRALACMLMGHWGNKRDTYLLILFLLSSLPLRPPSFLPSFISSSFLPSRPSSLSLYLSLKQYVYVRDEFWKEMV